MSDTDYTAGPIKVVKTDFDNGVGRGSEDSPHWGKAIAAFKGFTNVHPGMLFGHVRNDGPNSITLRCVCSDVLNGYGTNDTFGGTTTNTNSFRVMFRQRRGAYEPATKVLVFRDLDANLGSDTLVVPAGGSIDFFMLGIYADEVGGGANNSDGVQDYLMFFADESGGDFDSTRGTLTLASFFGALEPQSVMEVHGTAVDPVEVRWTAPTP
jgi:hypothetical protein